MTSPRPRGLQARRTSQDIARTTSVHHSNTPSAAGSSGWRSPSPEWLVSVSPINYPSSPTSNKFDPPANSPAFDPWSPGIADVPQTTSRSDVKVNPKRKRSSSATSPVTQPPVKRTSQAAATVLLVPGPTPERHPSISAWNSMNFLWSCIEVTEENAAKLSAIRGLNGFLYTAEQDEQRGTRQLFVHYMALAAYFLAVGQEVNVEVISWKDFLKVIKTTPERLYVYCSVFVRVTDEVDDLSRVALLDDDLALRRTFRSEMLQLVDKTILLPPVGEFEFAAKTFGLIKLLNRIATDDTHTMRPKTVLYNGKRQETTGEQYVLKREGHHCRSSPIVVREGDEPPDVDVTKGFRWMKQEYVPCMEQSPEWRVYMVQEKVVAAIPTKKDKHGVWRVAKSMDIWSVALRNERAKREESPDSDAGSPSIEPGSELDRRMEVRAITRFAETTIHALVLMEEKTNGRVPSISRLCRLDVGLYKDPKTGIYTHWVNSLARGAQALMYSVLDGNDTYIIEILEAVETMLRQLNEAGKYTALRHEPVRFAEPLSLYI